MMASENNGVLNSNNFNKNSSNYNNNETEISSTATTTVSSSSSSQATTLDNSTERKILGGGGNFRGSCGIDVLPVEQQPRREENPFSFKHFLNRDTTASCGSSNITSNNSSNTSGTQTFNTSAQALSNEQYTNCSSSNNNCNSINDDFVTTTTPTNTGLTSTSQTVTKIASSSSTSISSSSYQTSTGARPKVPQTIIMTSAHPLTTSMSSLVGESSKMKRSPRFSSFDSQASLAEFAGGGSTNNLRNDELDDVVPKDSNDSMNNFFPNTSDYDRQFVHRSYSNYDMELPPTSKVFEYTPTTRRRISPPRLNRSASTQQQQQQQQQQQSQTSNSPNSNLNLNLNLNSLKQQNQTQSNQKNHSSSSGGGGGGVGVVNNSHVRPTSEFSAALPDFVQDHWMDQWYYNDMNVSSPPNSPNSPVDFVEDLPGMGNPTEKCQTLPDFLSDGPIIHSSSSRLADVAAGLPDLDSPEENSPSLQLARLQLENHRLRRELDESRLTLAEQTRRAGELERRLEQARCNENAYSMSLAQSMGQVEENLDQSKKRAAAAQSQVAKLKQQVKQLTAEVDGLRRENESLREDGAVGGDRVTRRPSRTQQLSRDLMRAASNAENNLRELLTGVENLRLMAATIENMDRIAIDSNNQTNPIDEEFLSDCIVDFDDFSGPAL